MGKVFFTSDLHFGHKNLCIALREMSAEESDAIIIENWNKTVSKHDTVYVLGDITMEKHQSICDYIKKLNGRIVLIGGNHDVRRCCTMYQKLGVTVMGCLVYKGFICTHIPIHPTQLTGFQGNIHGHIHKSGIFIEQGVYDPPKIEGPYYNVNTEFHDFTPVPFEDIKSWFDKEYGGIDSVD